MKNCLHNTKRFLPFLGLSILTGFLSALFGMAFKLGAEWAIHLSAHVYNAVRQVPLWSPLLVLCVAALGLISGCIISRAQSCKGGGIPTSVAAVRGIVDFKWLFQHPAHCDRRYRCLPDRRAFRGRGFHRCGH